MNGFRGTSHELIQTEQEVLTELGNFNWPQEKRHRLSLEKRLQG